MNPPLPVVALGDFSTELPSSRLEEPQLLFARCARPEDLPPGEIPVLLTELAWLARLDAPARQHLAQVEAPAWVALADEGASCAERLAWQRSGVSHFLPSPLDPERLVALVEEIHDRRAGPPIRVLLVDEDAAILATLGGVLEGAGMAVSRQADALRALEVLVDVQPEVLLVAIRMSGCHGPELMAMIRQRPEFAELPVILLTASAAADEQLQARSCGAADLLAKSASGDLLLAAVRAQAWRYRARRRAEARRRLEESGSRHRLEQLRLALDEHAIVSITDVAGNIVHANDKFCAISGYRREELLGRNHRMIKSGIHPPEYYETLWRTIAAGRVWHGEVCNRRRDGSLYWVEATIVPLVDSSCRPSQYISIRTDITALKRSEEALRQSEERLRRSQAFANIGTWDWDIGSGALYWSERIAPLFGYGPGELETSYENFLAAIHPEDRQGVVDAVTACIDQDLPYDLEHRVVWPDGQVRWLLERGAVVRDDAGRPLHMLGVVQDITERKQAVMALARSEQRLQEAQLLAHLGNWEADLGTGSLSWSEEVCRIFGRDPAHFLPTAAAFFASVHGDDVARVLAEQRRAALTGSLDITHRIVRPDGAVRHVHALARAERDAAGEAVRLVGTIQDVTDHVEAEARLRETEMRFAFAVEGAGDGVWDWNMASGHMALSGNYEGMLGYGAGELEPAIDAWVASVHPDDLERAQQALDDYLNGRAPAYVVELRLRCQDGGYKWILCRGTIVARDGAGRPQRMIGIHSDISERKEAEERLELFRRIFDASDQAIGIADSAGRIAYLNRAGERLLGYTLAQVAGRRFDLFFPEAEREAIFAEIMSAAAAGRGLSRLLSMQRRDGSVFVSASNVGVIKDALHRVQQVFNIFTDFSEELARRAELAEAKESAERANQAKSDFLSSMSHELRTPMNAIIGFAQMLEYDEGLNADQQDNVQEILKAGRHLLDLINEVLDLAKIESGRIDLSIEPVALAPVFDDCRQLIQPLAAARQISLEVEAAAAVVRADRVRLKQVLLNLLANAIKYNREGGRVRLEARSGADGRLRIAVADTGPGIAPERLGELFQPFNRLAAENSAIEGTGIGLTITRRLTEMMAGAIGVDSVVGEGSTFWVELPAEDHLAPGGAVVATTAERALPAARRILCIDDNPANLKLVAQMLTRRRNLQLLTAHAPDLGIELALSHRPDLILMDINMPGMDGYQVLGVLQADARLRHIPVVAITANAMPRDIERGRAAGFCDYLTKPLDVALFLATLDRCLQGDGETCP